MPDPLNLAPSAVDVPDPQVWQGVVATDALTIEDEVYVTIPEFDSGEGQSWKHGPCKWLPRVRVDGIYYPKRGDSCVVSFAERADLWIVSWVSSASTPDDRFAVEEGDSPLSIFNAKDYGAVGDDRMDNAAPIQDAIDAARAAGGGMVYLPHGIYQVAAPLVLYSNIHLCGAGPEAATIKLANGADTDVVTVDSYGVNGITAFSVRDLAIFGNNANNAAGNGLLIDGRKFLLDNLYLSYASEDNLSVQATQDGTDLTGGTEALARHIKSWLADGRNVRWDAHDGNLVSIITICKDATQSKTNFLVDSRAGGTKLVACHSWGESKYAFDLTGEAEAVGCQAEGGVVANVILNGDNQRWTGGKVFCDDSDHGRTGFLWGTNKGYNSIIDGVRVSESLDGAFNFTGGDGANSRISGVVEQASGNVVIGSPGSSVTWGVTVFGGATNNIPASASGPLSLVTGAAGTNIVEAEVTRDSFKRFYMQTDGEMGFGPGNAAADLFIRRSARGVFEIAGSLDVSGDISVTVRPSWQAGFAVAANMPRQLSELSDLAPLVSGTLYLVGGMILPRGVRVSSLRVIAGDTAAGVPTNQWFCLVDQALNVLAKTSDGTTGAWARNSAKQLSLAAAYTPTEDIAVYVGIVVVATTVPTLRGVRLGYAFGPTWDDPDLNGASTTGLTTPASLGARAGATTPDGFIPYVVAI